MNPIIWRQPYVALLGIISGIVYQHLINCTHLEACLVAHGVLSGIAFYSLKQKTTNFGLYVAFFCLGSMTLLGHKKLAMLNFEWLKNQKYCYAFVDTSQEKLMNGSKRYNHTLSVNFGRHHQYKATIVNSPLKLIQGHKVLVRPQRLIFFENQAVNPWAQREKIITTAMAKKWGIKKIYQRPPTLWQKISNLKERLLSRTLKKMDDDPGKLYGSVFLGKKLIEATDPYRELFCTWGLSHFLARSGLHVSIFAGITWWLLSFVPIFSIFLRSLLALMMLLAYTLLSWQSISFYRATSTLCLILFARFFKQQANTLHLICLVSIWTLLSNPFELFCADFQLSFSLAFALMISGKMLNKQWTPKTV